MLRECNGVGDVKGNALDANTKLHVGRWLSEPRVDNDSVRLGIGQGDVKRQPFHQADLEMFQLVPERVVDVQSAHRPLEGRSYPEFGRQAWSARNGVVARLNTKALAKRGEPLKGEADRQIIGPITVDIDVVLEQDQVGAHKQFARERPLVPSLVGRSVVAGGEVDVDGVGVDADAQKIVQAKILG